MKVNFNTNTTPMQFCGSRCLRCPVAENVGSPGNPVHGSGWSFLIFQGSTSARKQGGLGGDVFE
jgi:hypothetical protein